MADMARDLLPGWLVKVPRWASDAAAKAAAMVAGESVLAVAEGYSSRGGLLILTDQRLLLQGARETLLDVPFAQIAGLSAAPGRCLRVFRKDGTRAEVSLFRPKDRFDEFVNLLERTAPAGLFRSASTEQASGILPGWLEKEPRWAADAATLAEGML